jgi:hypothetical protein
MLARRSRSISVQTQTVDYPLQLDSARRSRSPSESTAGAPGANGHHFTLARSRDRMYEEKGANCASYSNRWCESLSQDGEEGKVATKAQHIRIFHPWPPPPSLILLK